MGLFFFFEGYKNPKAFFEKNIVDVTWKRAVLIAFVVGLVSAVISFFAMNISGNFIASITPFWNQKYTSIFSLLILVVTPFFYPIGILFYAGILYIIGLILGGKGEFKNFYMLVILILLMLLPFQLIVSFIFFSLSLLFPNARLIIYMLGVVISLPILIYGVYLLTQALKISLNLATGRAVLVWLILGALWFFGAVMSIFLLFILQSNPFLSGLQNTSEGFDGLLVNANATESTVGFSVRNLGDSELFLIPKLVQLESNGIKCETRQSRSRGVQHEFVKISENEFGTQYIIYPGSKLSFSLEVQNEECKPKDDKFEYQVTMPFTDKDGVEVIKSGRVEGTVFKVPNIWG